MDRRLGHVEARICRKNEILTLNFFLDTNAIIRWVMNERVTNPLVEALQKTDSVFYISAISIYEIFFKLGLGKLDAKMTLVESAIDSLNAEYVAVSMTDAKAAAQLQWSNRDPWDRMIAAQAQRLNATLITSDRHFSQLPLKLLQI
jgi:PIN domain nuclease of toxin-antitoxin system